MEEAKRKELEAKLYQLFSQSNQNKDERQPVKTITGNVKVIRRRKGQPDFHIAWNKPVTIISNRGWKETISGCNFHVPGSVFRVSS